MQPISSPSVFPIDTAEAADILINPANLRLLEPFWGREASVAEAAKRLGVKANTLLKQVRRLEAAGLLEVSCEQPRRGRPVKLYSTVAERFFVPYRSSSSSDLTEAMAHKEAYWEDRFRRNLVLALEADLDGWGLEIFRNAAGHITALPVPEVGQVYNPLRPEHPATYSAWYDSLYLDFAAAKSLQRDLHELYERYRTQTGPQRYLLRLGVVALLDADAAS